MVGKKNHSLPPKCPHTAQKGYVLSGDHPGLDLEGTAAAAGLEVPDLEAGQDEGSEGPKANGRAGLTTNEVLQTK